MRVGCVGLSTVLQHSGENDISEPFSLQTCFSLSTDLDGLRIVIRLESGGGGTDCKSYRFCENKELGSCRNLRNESLLELKTSNASWNCFDWRSLSSVDKRFASMNFSRTRANFCDESFSRIS
ncbi:hypothetical protein HanIR_Chr15g0735241 [Helianthus annuus]|nr:hypothetical protein HanIR_Chr15g0735241 [Helianthus annuus]